MNKDEIQEINSLPPKYRPLGAWAYFGYSILFAIPIIGTVLLIVYALNDSNINRRSFARSYFCVLILAVILIVVLVVAGGGLLTMLSGVLQRK